MLIENGFQIELNKNVGIYLHVEIGRIIMRIMSVQMMPTFKRMSMIRMYCAVLCWGVWIWNVQIRMSCLDRIWLLANNNNAQKCWGCLQFAFRTNENNNNNKLWFHAILGFQFCFLLIIFIFICHTNWWNYIICQSNDLIQALLYYYEHVISTQKLEWAYFSHYSSMYK